MSSSEEPATEDTSPDASRSGADVAEAVRVAEQGSSVQQVHDRPGETRTREAPVEQTAGDPDMTEGRVVRGEGTPSGDAGTGPAAPEGVSGGRQSVQGARTPDRTAAAPSEG
ncbi:hypothetical protein [Geodermatophilus sp. TF02-6]|uniref:hypothetical protein n=1 Tax=Geodermatophilus sp. TF02-6 TaxID=2250575 RepID=UPI0011BEAEB3|nr:hypothetical protein [Geodermatophilus sp. TF02-6]